MKYPPVYFRDGLPEWKRKKDPILTGILYRKVSFYVSSLFCELGWTANAVSYLSTVVALGACVLFIFRHSVLGSILINIWLVLDCADGNIARCVKKERYGDFADAMSSYLCVGLLFPCMGYCSYHVGGAIFEAGNPNIILISALAGSSDSLMRLLYQKFINSGYRQGIALDDNENPERANRINEIRMHVDANLSLGGVLPKALLIASIYYWLDVVIIIWAIYYGSTLIAAALYFVYKTYKANKSSM